MTIADELETVLRAAGLTGFVHAAEIGQGRTTGGVDLRGGERVVIASVFKIAVSVAFHAAVADGDLDATERRVVGAGYRRGGVGIGGCRHDVDAALEDLAELMMTLSDNAATDVVIDAVTLPRVRRVLQDLGLTETAIAGRTIDEMEQEERELRLMGAPVPSDDPVDPWRDVPDELLLRLSTLAPATARTYSTPRDVTRLVDAIWTDRAAPATACAAVRGTMRRQVRANRISSGFDATYGIAGKTGTLEGVRNEAAVITTPRGRQFAVAIFTRSDDAAAHNPRHDLAIGTVARLCVDHLSSVVPHPDAATGRTPHAPARTH